jgi:hypothetical protein
VTAPPGEGFSLQFSFGHECDMGRARLHLPPSSRTEVLRITGGRWLVSVPEGKYVYALTVPQLRFSPAQTREPVSFQGTVVASHDRQLLAAYKVVRQSLDNLRLKPVPASYRVGDAAPASVSYGVAAKSLPENIQSAALGTLEACPRFGLPLEKEAPCLTQSVSVAAPNPSSMVWLVSPTKEGHLTAVLTLKLGMSVKGRFIEVLRTEQISFGRADQTFWQKVKGFAIDFAGFAAGWPAVGALLAAVGGVALSSWRWWRRRRAA